MPMTDSFSAFTLLNALIPLAVFVYLITYLLKRQIPCLKTKGKCHRLVPFLPAIIGTGLGAIPGLINTFLIPFAGPHPLQWHVCVILGLFGGLLSHALHGWIHKGLKVPKETE